MSETPSFVTVAHGINVPVVEPEHLAAGPTPQGIAIGRILTDMGERFAFTISHPSGVVLTALLDDAQYARFLGLITAVTNLASSDRGTLRFGEHG